MQDRREHYLKDLKDLTLTLTLALTSTTLIKLGLRKIITMSIDNKQSFQQRW